MGPGKQLHPPPCRALGSGCAWPIGGARGCSCGLEPGPLPRTSWGPATQPAAYQLWWKGTRGPRAWAFLPTYPTMPLSGHGQRPLNVTGACCPQPSPFLPTLTRSPQCAGKHSSLLHTNVCMCRHPSAYRCTHTTHEHMHAHTPHMYTAHMHMCTHTMHLHEINTPPT